MGIIPIKPDDIHNQIHEAAEQFQAAIEKLGMKNVVITYVYTQLDISDGKIGTIHCGYQAIGILQALGACEYIKNLINTGELNDEDD